MTDTTFDTVNDMGTQTMIGGSDQSFVFTCTDSNGAAINLTGSTCSMKISPYGQSDVATITKTGTITSAINGIFTVKLIPSDTSGLSGVYQCQPMILITVSAVLYTFLPGQFILNILEKIQ